MKKIVTDILNNIYIKEEPIKYSKSFESNNLIEIFKDKTISNFMGYGSAITESSAYNYSLLSDDLKKKFINCCYLTTGLDYDMGRISIGSNDFSLNSYYYSKRKDLSDFNIKRDYKYIIPMLKDIYKVKKISLIASPWSPPRMFKVLPILSYGVKLKKKYYDKYVSYLEKFINAYKLNGFKIDYLSMQNEPFAAQKWESCIFSLDEQKEFIYNYLNRLNIDILLHDHNRDNLYDICKYLYKDNTNVKGIAYHYYTKSNIHELKQVRNKYKDILMINSEMCCGYSKYNEINWLNDAVYYTKDIMNNINIGVNAYLDWNILLDFNGGPNHKNNYCKSAIILNEDKTNFIKTPIYYYLYHLSKVKGNIVETVSSNNNLKVVSSYSKKLKVTIYNDSDSTEEFNLIIDNKCINDKINSKSIITYEL